MIHTQPVTRSALAYKLGFSAALNPHTISAYQDAADYNFCGEYKNRRVKVAFTRGWADGYRILTSVKKEITNGDIVFVRDDGRYNELLAEKILLADFINSDVA